MLISTKRRIAIFLNEITENFEFSLMGINEKGHEHDFVREVVLLNLKKVM